jgi:hypothetical protein
MQNFHPLKHMLPNTEYHCKQSYLPIYGTYCHYNLRKRIVLMFLITLFAKFTCIQTCHFLHLNNLHDGTACIKQLL